MTLKWKWLVVSVAGLAALLGGCTKEAGTAALTPEVMAIEPGVGVGKIKAGMTTDDVVALFGEPQRKTASALEYTAHGFALMPGADKKVQVVMCGDVMGGSGPLVKRFTGRTKEGIGMTSTLQEVIKAYGPANKTNTFLGGRESLRYDELGMTFSLEGGKVHHIIVRLIPPETRPDSIEVTR